jgi:hypothetical protein
MLNIRYFYQNNKRSYKHESIIDSFAEAISQVIELPPLLEVCLYDLGKNVYGGIDMLRINRIGINLDVPLDELPKILAHELVHVHQKHKGTLKIKHNGNCYWHGILITTKLPDDMPYEEYMNLPWEMDAYDKQTKVLQQALDILTTSN